MGNKKIILVNKFCKINEENITNIDDRLIAINVVTNEEEKGFINYCLAIDSFWKCCETFGTAFSKISEFNSDNVFVSKIELDVSLDKEEAELLKKINNEFNKGYEYYACKVYGENDYLLAIGLVFNHHNGFYEHKVEVLENGKVIYEEYL